VTAVVDTMALARDERTDMAEFLASLSPEQWDAPTLCADWRVRELVAHMYSYDDLGMARTVARMVTSGFNTDRANAVGVAEHAHKRPDQLVAMARDHVRPAGLTAMMGGKIALTDGMIHQQDVRRPLGRSREIPADRLIAALDMAKTAPTIGAAKRIRGLKLTATDIEWTTGDGSEITGTGEALLMAIAGRRGITAELSGPGVGTLDERIGG
jgi:uncharacterized protein (TIGR03083 family)